MPKARRRKKNKKPLGFLIVIVLLILIAANVFDSGKVNDSKNSSPQEEQKWNLMLVNKSNPIPDDYSCDLMTLKDGHKIDRRIYSDLQEMFDDMRAQGIYPSISSAYRTYEEQEDMLNDKINVYISNGYSKHEAEKLAKQSVAVPGTSEHELGLALDIIADKSKSTNEEVYKWLNENSYKYGFIMRYPSQKSKITGVEYEPWHYRYVGKEAAKEIYEKDICLEEYLS